jgi:hypothetical protein
MSVPEQQASPGEMTKITVTQLLPMVYQDALQPGVKQLGIALESVLSLVPTLMLPFKYVSEAAKLRLSMRLDKLRKNLEAKAIEDIYPIAPEIGVPVVEKLLHVQDENLASLYLRLLEQASDKDGLASTHPSFPNLIGNLSPDEAAILQIFLDPDQVNTWPAAYFGLVAEGNKSIHLRGPLTGWEILVKLKQPNSIPAYVENMLRCGIFAFNHDTMYSKATSSDDRLERLGLRLKELYSQEFGTPMQKGVEIETSYLGLTVTEYGRMFIRACVVPQPDLLTGVNL